MLKLRNGSKGSFEPGLLSFRVRRSTVELRRSTKNDCIGDIDNKSGSIDILDAGYSDHHALQHQ